MPGFSGVAVTVTVSLAPDRTIGIESYSRIGRECGIRTRRSCLPLSRTPHSCELAPYQLGQGVCQPLVVIQHLGSLKLHAQLAGLLARLDVDVVENLEVVGDKTHRGHDHPSPASGRELHERVQQVGPKPGFARLARALERKPPLPRWHEPR